MAFLVSLHGRWLKVQSALCGIRIGFFLFPAEDFSGKTFPRHHGEPNDLEADLGANGAASGSSGEISSYKM